MKKQLAKKLSVFIIGAMMFSGAVNAQWTKTGNKVRLTTNTDSVGIGTTSPGYKLHVVGTTRLQGAATVTSALTASTTLTNVQNATLATGATYRVGIGTTAPTSKLHVVGPGNWDLNATEGDVKIGNGTYRLKMGVALAGGGAGDAYIAAHGGTQRLFLGTGNSAAYTKALTITSGKVGIDNEAPAQALDVTGNAAVSGDVYLPGSLRRDNTAGNQIVTFANSGSNDVGIQFFRPGAGSYDFRMVDQFGIVNFQGSGDDFATVTNHMSLNLLSATNRLSVCGGIRATEVIVESGWCDYVFADNYKLAPLSEVESFIKENKHLPDVTPGDVIETQGLELGKTQQQMIKKIEELTLYMIQLEKENKQLKDRVENLERK